MGEERKAKEAEWRLQKMAKDVEKLDENPYVSQITLIEQTLQFCKGLMPQEAAENKEEKKETVFNNKDGEVVLGKKEDRANEFYFAPTKKKGGAKKNKPAEDKTKKTIKHNAETFKLFDSLGLEAPITVADVPALLVKLEKQMETYQEKVQAWEDHKEEMKRKIQEGEVTYDELLKDGKDEEKEAAEEEKEEDKEEAEDEEKE